MYEALNSQISFLRNELASKDEIIRTLISDRKNENLTNHIKQDNVKIQDNNINFNAHVAQSGEDINVDKNTSSDKNKDKEEKNSKRTVTLIGDSMIKNIQGYKMKQGMLMGEKVFVRCFPGAQTECMTDYIKPSLKYNPDAVVLHVGTNDLRNNKTPEEIGKDILSLATQIKTLNNEVIVSSIIIRNDSFNEKGNNVNNFLRLNCEKNKLLYCDNSNISKGCLNAGGLHLNPRGTISLANNFLKCLNY